MEVRKEWDGKCHRCQVESHVHTMSWFNTDLICPKCDRDERNHVEIDQARAADWEALMQGNSNFPGIGKPHDL